MINEKEDVRDENNYSSKKHRVNIVNRKLFNAEIVTEVDSKSNETKNISCDNTNSQDKNIQDENNKNRNRADENHLDNDKKTDFKEIKTVVSEVSSGNKMLDGQIRNRTSVLKHQQHNLVNEATFI